jgi:regulator of replication initiation timing
MKKLLSKSLLKKPKDIIAKGLLWVKNCIQVSALPLVTVIIVFPASPIWAKNCPSVPKETKEVTVKDDDATLRIEPKKSSQKGSPIGKGDKLGVINNKPTQDSEGNDYCWYKVKFLTGSDAKQYWIADIGLIEFSSWPITPSPTTTPSVSPTPGGTSPNPREKELSVPWIVWVLAPIGIIVVSLFTYDRIKRKGYFNNFSSNSVKTDNLSSSNPDTTTTNVNQNTPSSEQSLHLIALMAQEYLPKIVKLAEENVNQDSVKEVHKIKSTVTKQDSELKAEISELKAEISELKAEISELKAENSELKAEISKLKAEISTTTPESENKVDKKEWEKLVDKFNERKKDHFTNLNPKPQFLKLNDQSIHGKPSTVGSTIVQLVSSTESEASYLKIEVDQENWLFPNILSTQVDKIISILKPSIFTIDVSLKNPQLKKPAKLLKKTAKLQDAGGEIWEIAERGEFT